MVEKVGGIIFKIIVEKDNKKYSWTDISEKMGNEIADIEYEDGWIRRFSQIDVHSAMKGE